MKLENQINRESSNSPPSSLLYSQIGWLCLLPDLKRVRKNRKERNTMGLSEWFLFSKMEFFPKFGLVENCPPNSRIFDIIPFMFGYKSKRKWECVRQIMSLPCRHKGKPSNVECIYVLKWMDRSNIFLRRLLNFKIFYIHLDISSPLLCYLHKQLATVGSEERGGDLFCLPEN